MTKSGIGTHQPQSNMSLNTTTNSNNTNNNGSTHTPQSQTPTLPSSSSLIANAEIPIWVADKKKWVTGISKKTTINDLIFAILKQCQIVPQKNQLQNESEPLSSQYVLIEYNFEPNADAEHQVVLASQRILNGDSKVYKYLVKWSFSGPQPQQNNNLMLKILQRQAYETSPSLNSDQNSHHNDTVTSNQGLNGNEQRGNSTSLATKLLKKFGVSSSTNLPNQASKSVNAPPASNQSTAYRYVDVKLPALSSSQSQPNQLGTNNNSNPSSNKSFNNLSPISTNSTGSLNNSTNNANSKLKNFDPNVQKSFVTNSIMEKDNKLKQQIKRFQLIDELIKETEKKTKSVSSTSGLFDNTNNIISPSSSVSTGFLTNPTYNYSPGNNTNTTTNNNNIAHQSTTVDISSLIPTSEANKSLNVIDLNDVYCHFPEMSTHHLKEVEDFTIMCSQLFQLEEAIKNQKQILNTLEVDLQRELQPNQATFLADNSTGIISQLDQSIETPETEELRKEVNYSREQTRLQCKQLHDLDMRMKQNEQNLMSKEQELQQLLEELYIQEIYADNVLETAITNTNTTPNRPTTPSGNNLSGMNMSSFKLSANSPNSVNNLVSMNNKSSMVNLHHDQDAHNESSGMQNETMDSFENNENNITHDREKMVELIINERNSFNNSNIDFMQQQKRIAMENALDHHTKRQIRLMQDTNDDILKNTNDHIKSHNSIKIVNQTPSGNNQLQTQNKSLSFSNLANHSGSTQNLHITSPQQQQQQQQMFHNQHQKINQIKNGSQKSNLNHSLSINKSYNTNNNINHENHQENHNQSLTTSMKNIKIQNSSNQFINPQSSQGVSSNNSNGDHSGGDNDSGISSMSSETAAALNSNIMQTNSFNYTQKPIIMNRQNHQIFNNGNHNTQNQQYVSNGPQTQFMHRQMYQNSGNTNVNNISINQNANTSANSVSKAVLETLV